MINKETLSKIAVVELKIESANDTAYFKKWNGKDRMQHLTGIMNMKDVEDVEQNVSFIAGIVQSSLTDEKGNNIYSENEIDSIKEIDGEILDELFSKVLIANGLGEKSLKDEVKN